MKKILNCAEAGGFRVYLSQKLLGFLSLSVWAALKNYHGCGGLDNQHGFLLVLEAGESNVKVLADLLSGKDLLAGL